MPKIVNYSVEMTDKIISDYQNGTEISEIADAIGKSVRSVRSKLVIGVILASVSQRKCCLMKKQCLSCMFFINLS